MIRRTVVPTQFAGILNLGITRRKARRTMKTNLTTNGRNYLGSISILNVRIPKMSLSFPQKRRTISITCFSSLKFFPPISKIHHAHIAVCLHQAKLAHEKKNSTDRISPNSTETQFNRLCRSPSTCERGWCNISQLILIVCISSSYTLHHCHLLKIKFTCFYHLTEQLSLYFLSFLSVITHLGI